MGIWLATAFESIRRPSATTAAEVSSQLDSMVKTSISELILEDGAHFVGRPAAGVELEVGLVGPLGLRVATGDLVGRSELEVQLARLEPQALGAREVLDRLAVAVVVQRRLPVQKGD